MDKDIAPSPTVAAMVQDLGDRRSSLVAILSCVLVQSENQEFLRF